MNRAPEIEQRISELQDRLKCFYDCPFTLSEIKKELESLWIALSKIEKRKNKKRSAA